MAIVKPSRRNQSLPVLSSGVKFCSRLVIKSDNLPEVCRVPTQSSSVAVQVARMSAGSEHRFEADSRQKLQATPNFVLGSAVNRCGFQYPALQTLDVWFD